MKAVRWVQAWLVALGVTVMAMRRSKGCLRTANGRGMMMSMESTERLVLVPMTQLDDLLELARAAIERLPDSDPLRWHLQGATSAVRAAATAEP